MAWYSSFLRGKDRAFKRAHPYIEDFYTTQQKDEARRQFSLYLVVGIALIFIGLMVVIIFDGTRFEDREAASALFVLIACGTWCIIRGSMIRARTDIAQWNTKAAHGGLESTATESASVPSKKQRLTQNICSLIMIVATLIGVTWMLLTPVIAGKSWDAIQWTGANAGTGLFWICWPIGGLCCALVHPLVDMLYREK